MAREAQQRKIVNRKADSVNEIDKYALTHILKSTQHTILVKVTSKLNQDFDSQVSVITTS